ncbi:hypothetical protein Nepgr_029662 [Nepenthes gracilis]|uniref:Uncharacterized protein n=1 Tax=Nepenthes gracilis TaxID=150966 RepID=A0AAD3TEQ7_NEPGR|nr:hypothetical protein Nepgr_029662 [Nepenthes gracilis]
MLHQNQPDMDRHTTRELQQAKNETKIRQQLKTVEMPSGAISRGFTPPWNSSQGKKNRNCYFLTVHALLVVHWYIVIGGNAGQSWTSLAPTSSVVPLGEALVLAVVVRADNDFA